MVELHSPEHASAWLSARVRGQIWCDSRQVQPGDGFIAWPGAAVDGRRFVAPALAQGASACVVEKAGLQDYAFNNDAIACYAGLKAACGPLAAQFYQQPSHAIEVLAVTGTNGKTSSAWWLAQALNARAQQSGQAGAGCALIGTLGAGVPPALQTTGLTTPDPISMQRLLRQFVAQGLSRCVMEASSIGIEERRLDGTHLRVALFTNFSQDHLDYHGSMDAYWAAKAQLFDWPGLQAAVINIDDPKGPSLAQHCRARGLAVWEVSRLGPARLRAERITYHPHGMQIELSEGRQRASLNTNLIGAYNASNLLGVVAALRALGLPLETAAQACAHLQAPPGRLQQVSQPGCPLAVVDYAHTPDALAQALAALRPLAQARSGQLWCVFGCGGARDALKRPLMAAEAERSADHLILTSDNPRNEDPQAIIAQMLKGLSAPERATVLVDRAQAIAHALSAATSADVVLIAGKGHEDYQEIQGQRRAFSDWQQAQAALQARAAS